MYTNFWYPVCSSEDLTSNVPLRAKILGLNFAAFRDAEGNAHVLADTCVHRGGSLSKGKVVGNCIECPYHGWQYAGDGRCARIPTLSTGRPPARARVDSYPVIDRYGIVFAFLGDLPEEERAPFHEIAEWGKPGWRDSGLAIIELNAYFERSIENGLDPVHNEFVHTLQGNIRFRPECMTISESTWGSAVFVRMDPPKAGTTQLEFLRNDLAPEHFSASSGHYGPNTLETRINLSKDNNFVQYFFEQPVDANHTRIFFINMRNCMLEESNDARMQQINLAIADEDIAVIQELYPVRTPGTAAKELLIVGDECISVYRKFLKNWEHRGWRIDTRALRDGSVDKAYAIPCPARRSSGNWVLDAVPLVPGINPEIH
jgi:phenylpropionate dioxygenase-like ring-hydroxylating dioxygenase large terminal subunit